MAFHGVVCCLHRCQIVIRLWYVRQPTNLPQGIIGWWAMNMPVIQQVLGSILHTEALFSYICRQLFLVLKNSISSILPCYRDACGYIKKVWIVNNAINGLFYVHLYGFAIINVD